MTARRHELASRKAPPSRSATQPLIHSAAASQAAGMQRLSGLTHSVRRIVTLPSLPSSGTSEPAPSQSQSSSQSVPALPLLPAVPIQIQTPAERREAERLLKEEDRRQAIREFARYKNEGLESASGFNLIQYWDVS